MKRICCIALLVAMPLPLVAQDAEADAVKLLEEKTAVVHRQKSKPYAVQTVSLFNADITDLHGTLLSTFPSLEHVLLDNTKVGDATMLELAKCRKLKTLTARNTQVTDAGMKGIGAMKTLQMLDLRGTQISDTGLKELA